MTQSEMERRIADLERRIAGGGLCGQPGLSTLFGTTSVAYRDRFPARITSTFDAADGYSWERLFLTLGSASSVVTALGPQSGDHAFTPDNDETLEVGDRGWLEADPTAAGWIFLKMGSATTGHCSGSCGSLVGLLTTWCLTLEVVCNTGEFAHADFAQDFDGVAIENAQFRNTAGDVWTLQYWDETTSAWVNWTFDYVGGSGVVTYNRATQVLAIGGVALKQLCFGRDAVYAGGPALGLDGDATLRSALSPCDDNDFQLRISCGCCWPDEWIGTQAWYCVDAEAGDCLGDTVCSQFTQPPCAGDVVLCSSHASQAACVTVCTPVSGADCTTLCGRALNGTLYAVVSGQGTVTLTWDGTTYYVGSAALPCGTLYVRVSLPCDATIGNVVVENSNDGSTWSAAAAPSPPVRACGPPFMLGSGTIGEQYRTDIGLTSCGGLLFYITE